MNIQGISGSQIQTRTFNQGTTLNQIKDSIKNNGLSEVVVKNNEGFHVVYGQNLQLETDYFNQSSDSMVVTNLSQPRQHPKEGAQVSFGDLQGELVTTDSLACSDNKGEIMKYSMLTGATLAVGIGFSLSKTSSLYPNMSSILGSVFENAVIAGIGAGVGMAVGAALTTSAEQNKVNDCNLKAISQPTP
jgi:hypothetical protein